MASSGRGDESTTAASERSASGVEPPMNRRRPSGAGAAIPTSSFCCAAERGPPLLDNISANPNTNVADPPSVPLPTSSAGSGSRGVASQLAADGSTEERRRMPRLIRAKAI